MGIILNKLWASKNTIIILLWVAVFAYVYNLNYIKKPVIHQPRQPSKTLEEIMATPVDKTTESDWDKDFKSTIEAAE